MATYTNLIFPGGISTDLKGSFDTAAAFWNNVVKSGAPKYTFTKDLDVASSACGMEYTFKKGDVINGLVIFADTPLIDGPGQILGRAGPCMFNGDFPLLGIMEFDSADAQMLLDSGQFTQVVVHEMGHVLGLGTLWPMLGLLEDKCVGSKECDPYYIGPKGIEGYGDLNPATGMSEFPLVENSGGRGTKNGHWREVTFENELMTGYLNSGVDNPLSVLTVKSLQDMGYTVDLTASEGYTIPANLAVADRVSSSETGKLLAEFVSDIIIFDFADVRDVVAQFGTEPEEISHTTEFGGVFAIMLAGFALVVGLMLKIQSNQRRALSSLQKTQTISTKSPMHLAEL